MKNHASLALLLIFSLFISITAQQNPNPKPNPQTTPQQTTPQQEQVEKEDVVRITTNLVQVDAVVTDKSGKQVTDLRPEEMEIYEDGRQQKITNFSYISTEGGTMQPVAAKPAAAVDKNAPPVPPVSLKPEQVRRTIAVVVDDLGLSFESTYYVRQALKKFVDQQVAPGDLVAIVRTAGGMGALQQFTSDKRQLYAAIDRVKWNPQGRGGVGAFAPMEGASLSQDQSQNRNSDSTSTTNGAGEDIDQFREELFSVGTLGALNYVVRGMRELPGRKSILLMSDGFKIFNRDDPAGSRRVLEALQRLTDLANRASVVIYTMDARGLVYTGLTAADNTSGMSADQVESQLDNRRNDLFDSQSGLIYLAQQTGGVAIRNSNDLSRGIRRVLDDQKGYYLIGYRPDQSTFDPKTGRRRFHKISIKAKRPGLTVRSRTGFYGVTDEEAAPRPRTPVQQMISALISPFAESGIHLRLTSLFANAAKGGSFMRSMLHIEAKDLTFTDEPDGWHKAVFDILAVTFGDNGSVVDQIGRTHTLRIRGETYKRILESGFVYYVTVPVKKPGAYQLRAALRDSASERVGSASQFIEVPDINKNRLTISGIVVAGLNPSAASGGDKGATSAQTQQQQPAAADAEAKAEGEELTDPLSTPAVRKFRQGTLMQFNYIIYNAQLDKATRTPQLQTQIRLFRDGKQVFAGKEQPFNPANQPDLKRLIAGGVLRLGADLTPGEYILQVVVTDPLAKDKYRVATQWIDFEVVK
ncbi:MAG: VWA domain-containing protein [Acidobacteriota bacterium]|nr:VWA domain-containing protein [Acidobacteriota bacterium]